MRDLSAYLVRHGGRDDRNATDPAAAGAPVVTVEPGRLVGQLRVRVTAANQAWTRRFVVTIGADEEPAGHLAEQPHAHDAADGELRLVLPTGGER